MLARRGELVHDRQQFSQAQGGRDMDGIWVSMENTGVAYIAADGALAYPIQQGEMRSFQGTICVVVAAAIGYYLFHAPPPASGEQLTRSQPPQGAAPATVKGAAPQAYVPDDARPVEANYREPAPAADPWQRPVADISEMFGNPAALDANADYIHATVESMLTSGTIHAINSAGLIEWGAGRFDVANAEALVLASCWLGDPCQGNWAYGRQQTPLPYAQWLQTVASPEWYAQVDARAAEIVDAYRRHDTEALRQFAKIVPAGQ